MNGIEATTIMKQQLSWSNNDNKYQVKNNNKISKKKAYKRWFIGFFNDYFYDQHPHLVKKFTTFTREREAVSTFQKKVHSHVRGYKVQNTATNNDTYRWGV